MDEFYMVPETVGNVMTFPTDWNTLIFFRGVGKAPETDHVHQKMIMTRSTSG